MFTFIPMGNGFRRAAPLALIVAFGLAACGGGYSGGGGAGYGMSTAGPASKLFAADSPHMAIGSLVNPNPGAGMITVDRVIMGSLYTGLSNNIGSLALDPALDYLYVGNGTSVRVFYMASMANGDATPLRVISGIGNTGSLFLDTTPNNRLYVGDDAFGVRVFDNASMISDPTSSARVITGLGTVHGVAVDTGSNDILYVSNTTSTPSNQINLFTASTAQDPATPLKTITPTDTGVNLPVGGISLDMANDRLYVAGFTDNKVRVFDAVHNTPGGMIAPTKTLTFPATISNVVIDAANNRLYAVSLGAIYILNNASAAMDPITVTAVLVPSMGSFTAVAVTP